VKFLVHANVLSEATKPVANARVLDWLRTHERDLAINPVVLVELRFGILLLPRSKRRTALEHWFDAGAASLVCLSWDADTGAKWAELLARLRRAGKAMPIKDSLIAATPLVHNLTVATRNRAGFSNAGVRIIDPFVD
jgi:predicted nucleic acid-binding protein